MIKCPYCGKSYYQEHYSTRTAVYYPPIYKDGVNVNPDRNTTKTKCTCLECNHYFYIVNGEYTIEGGECPKAEPVFQTINAITLSTDNIL
jgi:hypothetical protein